jgi:hypothetical protein
LKHQGKIKKRGISTVLATSVIAVVILAGFLLILYLSEKNIRKEGGSCFFNTDCVKVQTSCCPCSSGGEERCVAKSEAASFEKNLENCPEDNFCAQVYSCNITDCVCREGKCRGKS